MDFQRPVEAVIPGAQGRILSVLVETTAPLNLGTLASLAGVSVAQASRVMPGLVELGLVERQEVPPSSLFLLSRSNVAAQAIVELARSRDNALEQIGAGTAPLRIRPKAVIVFGSFVRGEAHSDSDIDIARRMANRRRRADGQPRRDGRGESHRSQIEVEWAIRT
jgi:DNA-binding IclR family transcriptional regulator